MTPGTIHDSAVEPLAIIGMSGRFPGARTLDEFWGNLRDGRETVTFFDEQELLLTGLSEGVVRHPRYVRARGSLGDLDLFDAAFFGYTPKEAQAMDPQQRLFLEHAHTALEAAGYGGEAYAGSVGVYAGSGLNAYLLGNLVSHPEMFQYVGFDKDYLATRVSYKLNLKGPSIVVQTACSTSLVAICQAAQALLTYQCDIALAGGVALALPDRAGYFYAEGAIFSPDGHCRPFDAAAQGIVPGSGVGVVVLKRLQDAIADGDMIHAVLRGFALNNDGAAKVGYTAPSVEGQAQAILMAQDLAGITGDTISYIEAHGTATPLGDPVEIAALTQAFRATTDRKGYCAIGSVKSNIGHLDAAAGVASLIKTVLALRHRQLPPSLHFTRPNPKIDFENSPFYVNTQLADWPAGPTPRRAGVSSFGIGGTNAHVVLEEAPDRDPSGSSRPWQVLVMSARSAPALEVAAAQLASYLGSTGDPVADVAFTLQTGRTRFAHRCAVICQDTAGAAAALSASGASTVRNATGDEGEPAVVFMFPGQGTQYAGMGGDLYTQENVFRRAIDDCAALASRDLDVDLRSIICPVDDVERRAAAAHLESTRIAQPALFAVEYATACLWMSWGIRPAAMIGHSLGEYVAACVSGVFDLADAVRIVCVRAAAMAEAPAGAMLAVGLSETAVRDRLGAGLWLAAVNAPAWTVVAGDCARVAELEEALTNDGVPVQRLHTAGAFHSGLMRDVAGVLAKAIAGVQAAPPRIPYVSNLTGTWVRPDEVRDPAYWARQAIEPVRFVEGVEELAAFGGHVFLEVGPGQTLGRLVEQCLPHTAARPAPVVAASLPGPRDRLRGPQTIAEALGSLWVAGAPVDWRGYYAAERRLRVGLPTYPFERQRYWLAPTLQPQRAVASIERRLDAADWFSIPSWKRTPPPRAVPGAGACLLFADDSGVGDALAARMRAQGRAVTVVRTGVTAAAFGDDLTILPSNRSHYDWLSAELRDRGSVPDTVVHLWGVTGQAPDAPRSEIEARCFYSLVHLARLLGSDESIAGRSLVVVTDGVYDVTGHERLNPFKALALGPCRVAPQEYSSLACRHIDIALDGPDISAVAGRLAVEIDSASIVPSIACRGIDRWVPVLEPMHLEAREARDDAPAPLLRDRGVYLITGGFGGIGLEIARHLALTVNASLVLTSRDPLPPRSRWPERLARGADARTVQRIHAVQTLEALGARVTVAQADVCDEDGMRAVVEEIRKQHGAIDGVIHAAGVPGGGVIHLKTDDAAARVLAPKVAGLDVLMRVLEAERPDFIALCSSITSLSGGFGQVDYCAANAVLDAFARFRTTRSGGFTLAINWDAWRDVGMSVETRVPRELEARRAAALERAITPAEGVQAFVRALHAGVPQVVVSPSDLSVLVAAAEGQASGSSVPAPIIRPANDAPARSRPPLQTAFVPPADAIEEAVCSAWQEALGVDRVGAQDSFFDLGGHSVLAIQVVARLNQRFNTRVPVARLYEGMTPAFLADAIRGTLGQSVRDDAAAEPRRERARHQKQQHQQRRQAARQVDRSAVMESVVPEGVVGAKTGDR